MVARYLLLLISLPVLGQSMCPEQLPDFRGIDSSGTVIVTAHNTQRLILATDSRRTKKNGYEDGVCKILVLDRKTVFVGSAWVSHKKGKVVFWQAYADAVGAFDNSKRYGSTTRLENAAIVWGQQSVKAVNRALVSDPVDSRAKLDHNVFYNGLFMGFTDGVAEMYVVQITYDPATQKANKHLVTYNIGPKLVFGAGGWTETVLEVLAGKTEFAISEAARFQMDIHTHNYTEQDGPPHWAIRLAELSELYGPHKDQVGGPIDALEITRHGINWIQCESSCQCSDGPQKIPEADSR